MFDRASTDDYFPVVFAWDASAAPDSDAAVDAPLAAVARYPHLAGRMGVDGHGRRCFHLNNAEVLVVEATADALARGMPAHTELYPQADKGTRRRTAVPGAADAVPVRRAGVGTTLQHLVADGHSMSSFYTAWAAAMRTGFATLPPPLFTDRAAIFVPRRPPAVAFDHRNTEFRLRNTTSHHRSDYPVIPMDRIKNTSVHFPAEFIAGLKARAGASGRQCTAFQCLLAHVWKKATAARGVAPGELTRFRIAVDCRGRAAATAGVPAADFFGNMVLWAFPGMRAGDSSTSQLDPDQASPSRSGYMGGRSPNQHSTRRGRRNKAQAEPATDIAPIKMGSNIQKRVPPFHRLGFRPMRRLGGDTRRRGVGFEVYSRY
ncbi:hypothetical protein ACP4OV_012195 [Aristida adscensionis]